MATGIPEYIERSKKLGYGHKEYVAWCNYLMEKHPEKGTSKTYANDIINFLELCKKDIKDICYEDVKKYISGASKSTQKKHVYAIANFMEFVKNNYYENINCNCDLILSEILYSDEDEEKKVAEPLQIDQIISLRNQLYNEGDYRRLFIFELIYTYGATLDELVQCSKNAYSFDTNSFALKTRTIVLNDFLAKLCVENPKLLTKHDRGGYQYHISQLKKYIGRTVRYMDIIATRKEHLIKCPLCGNTELNTSDNWVLAEREDDNVFHKKWLICKSHTIGGNHNE